MDNTQIKALIHGAVKPHQVDAVYDVIVNDVTCYLAEKQHDLPPNTLTKLVAKVNKKIEEFKEFKK